MAKLTYTENLLGVDDTEYLITYQVDVDQDGVSVEAISIDGIPPYKSSIPMDDLSHILNKIGANYDIGEHLDQIKAQEWESYNERDNG